FTPGAAVDLLACLSKWAIREKIWDYMEVNNLADFPRPVHHRIPNFKGSHQACCSVKELDAFDRTREVKVDPDKPLEGIRLAALQARKTLLVPTPRLRTGLFNKIVPPPGATKEVLRKCATSQISYEMMEKIPILKNLRYREKQAGKDVTLKDELPDFPYARKPAALEQTAKTEKASLQAESASAPSGQRDVGTDSLRAKSDPPKALTTVYVGNIPEGTRVSEFKSTIRELSATPARIVWQGAQHRAFLDYKDKATADSAVSSLQGLSLGGNSLRVELAKNQRRKGQVEMHRNKSE
uniref:Methenyltetrahydrofolate synthetase domain containing n=1 Tax=Sphenodon punctatus TaxID=8508 RepID=A0A8D0GRK9_SPHPU